MVSFKIGRNKPEACSCCTSPPCPSPLARDALCQDFKSEMLATQLKEPCNSFCYGIGVGPSVKHVLRWSLNVFVIVIVFLAVQNSSIGDLVTHSLTHSVTHDFTIDIQRAILKTCDPRDMWPLRHLIRAMRKHCQRHNGPRVLSP